MILGITGGTGCGKTTLLKVIEEKGGLILDCDAIYHQLLATDKGLLKAIEDRFPGTVENGQLQRKKLGAIVFSDENALLDLNKITHGAVRAEVLRQLESRPRLAAIDAIALFEGGLAELCDITVAVLAPEERRIARIMARDGIDLERAVSRVRAQKPESYYRTHVDSILENGGTRDDLLRQAESLLADYL